MTNTQGKKKVTMIDPASGWQYGFPKPVPDNYFDADFNCVEWLVSQGYPRELTKYHCRFWVEEVEDASNSN